MPERLIAQMSYLAEAHRARTFFIVDDQFAQDRAETLRFCRLLREYQERMGLKFFVTVQIRLDCARDEELLTAMRACNIRCLAIGIESPIDEELHAMGKSLRAVDMVRLARNYHRHGFLIHGMFIFWVLVHTLRFPLAMLPLLNLRSRWSKWYRSWRNDVVGSGGYFMVRKWRRAFKEGHFSEKLMRSRTGTKHTPG